MKYRHFLLVLIPLCCLPTLAQFKYEREYRIRKSQFPEKAHEFIREKLEGARRVRFYRETDSAKTTYEVKFKKDRLHYSVEFNEGGELEDIEIIIGKVDIPNDALARMKAYMDHHFKKYRIRKIQQQYPAMPGVPVATTLRNAFQNLLLPSLRYELIIAGKESGPYMDYEILFDATGNFLSMRTSLPANYDHVLY